MGYFAVTGRDAFEGKTVEEVVDRQMNEPAPTVPAGDDELSAALASAVDRCLAKDPAARFQTAGDLAKALDAALESQAELPLPLHAFVMRLRHTSDTGAGVRLVGAVIAFGMLASLWAGRWSAALVLGGVLAVVIVYPVAIVLPVTRRVLRSGRTRADVVHALERDVARRQRALDEEFGDDILLAERFARGVTYAGMGLFGLGLAAGSLSSGVSAESAVLAMAAGAVTAVAASVVATKQQRRRHDLTGKRWRRFWRSRVGAWVTRIAALGLKQTRAAPDSLAAIAARRMREGIPSKVQEQLRDLPEALAPRSVSGGENTERHGDPDA